MQQPMPKSHLPLGEKGSVLQINGFTGIDRRGGIGAEILAEAEGFDTLFLPEAIPACTPRDMEVALPGGEPIAIHRMGHDLFVVSNMSGMGLLTRIRPGKAAQTVTLGTRYAGAARTVICFNRYTHPLDPLNGDFVRAGIIYPDMLSFDLDAEKFEVVPFMPEDGVMPPAFSQACVHLSRVFGISDNRLFASAYNDPCDFNLDTAIDVGAANAWASTVQSGKTGDFTAATVFDGHVLMMREDATYIINGTKNPFRVAELLPVGAYSAKSVATTEDTLFFAAEHEVYRYDGATLYPIGAPLGKSDFRGAVGAACDGRYYLALPGERTVFVFDTQKNAWGSLGVFTDAEIISATDDTKNCYFLTADDHVFTTEGAEINEFYYKTAPFAQGGMRPFRPLRMAVLYTASAGSSLTVSVALADGTEIPIFSCEGDGSTRAEESRSYLPKDTCFALAFRGRGQVRIHSLRLTAVDGE